MSVHLHLSVAGRACFGQIVRLVQPPASRHMVKPMADGSSDPTSVTGSAQIVASPGPSPAQVAAPTDTRSVPASPSPLSFWDRAAAFIKRPDVLAAAGIAAAGVAAALLLSKRDDDDDASEDGSEEPFPESFPPMPLSAAERLAINREEGQSFERSVGDALAERFPNAVVLSQVSVQTPDGKRRRPDFALLNRNGSVTSVEVKNVSELRKAHVQQALDHRAGLKHTHGVRSGSPIVVVPEHAVVSEELAEHVRIFRHST